MPMAPPTRRRPLSSLQEAGYLRIFSISFMVISPRRRFSSSTTNSFSMRLLCRCSLASSKVVPTGTVTSLRLVITSFTRVFSRSLTKRTSRLVKMPTSLVPRTTGRPETLNSLIRRKASATLLFGAMVTGAVIMPLSDFFTFSTSSFCCSMLMFL